MKKILFILLFTLFSSVIFTLAVRGIAGNPKSSELMEPKWREEGPFELSPERGRFALLYSLIEDKSFSFSIDIARFATPDVALTNNKYVSLFAPLVSFTAIPGYLLGRTVGLSQVGAFATIALFAILNMLLIRALAIRFGAKNLAATAGSILFAFASPAFAYGSTLYQHHISTFLILATLFIITKWKNWISLAIVWLLFAASIPVDYPNLVLMFPLALFATTRMIWLTKETKSIKLSINWVKLISVITVVIPLLFYIWFSQNSYGKPLQLSGTLKSVQSINSKGQPDKSDLVINNPVPQPVKETGPEKKKTAAGFFKTRNILNGLYLHFVSPDRGMVFFTPIMFLSIIGGFFLWKTKQKELALIAGVVGANVLLYSMWGDPWGGWAFGSRYLIPSYALLAILLGVAISKLRRNFFFLLLFLPLGIYSIAVNTLGAITSSTNPPQVEVLALETQSHRQEKYTIERNWDFLRLQGSKSFIYNTYGKQYLTSVQYYWLIVAAISFVLVSFSATLFFNKSNKQ